jgi:hypothetical protein
VIYSEPDPERRQDIERLKAGVADHDALRERAAALHAPPREPGDGGDASG